MDIKRQSNNRYFEYIILAASIFFPLFAHLDALPIRLWDESRLATNAYEMIKNGDIIVTHYEGKPDMWNTKPPLMIWFQAIFMKVVGVNELAVRLPSAIAGAITSILLLILSVKYLKSFWFGFIASMVLVTSSGYVEIHGTRTGDYDPLLGMFIALSGFCYFWFIQSKNHHFLYYFFIALSLAVLTKGVNGLVFLPGIFIYTLLNKRVIEILKEKHFYFGIAIFLGTAGGYYLLREYFNPGYLLSVWQNEWVGRYLEVTDNSPGGFNFYLMGLIKSRYNYYYILAFSGIFLGTFSKDKRIANLTVFTSIITASYLLVISYSETKFPWYDTPLYPFLSVLTAVTIYFIFQLLAKWSWFKEELTENVVPFLFIAVILYFPYKATLDKTFKPVENHSEANFYSLSNFLKDRLRNPSQADTISLFTTGYVPYINFYYNLLKDKGDNLQRKNEGDFHPGDNVLVGQEHPYNIIKRDFSFSIVYKNRSTYILKLNNRINK